MEGSWPIRLVRKTSPDPFGPREVAADGIVCGDGRFLPWLLLREAAVEGRRLVLRFRAPDGRIAWVEIGDGEYEDWEAVVEAVRSRTAWAWPDRPGSAARRLTVRDVAEAVRDAAPRIVVAAAAAGAVAAMLARAAAALLEGELPPDVVWFLGRRGGEAYGLLGLAAGAVAGEAARRAVETTAVRRAAPALRAEEVAGRMEASGEGEVRARARNVEIAWRVRRGSWETVVAVDGRETWRAGATPAEAREGLARLAAAGAVLEPLEPAGRPG